jgi:hypothetical protein
VWISRQGSGIRSAQIERDLSDNITIKLEKSKQLECDPIQMKRIALWSDQDLEPTARVGVGGAGGRCPPEGLPPTDDRFEGTHQRENTCRFRRLVSGQP